MAMNSYNYPHSSYLVLLLAKNSMLGKKPSNFLPQKARLQKREYKDQTDKSVLDMATFFCHRNFYKYLQI